MQVPCRDVGLQERAANYQHSSLDRLAKQLGVTVGSLRRLGVGADDNAWGFPMVDAERVVVGIRLRLPDGRKFSVRGGHEGLFVPEGLGVCNPLLIAEGPTDTAALLDLGFDAVGRPSCTGGRDRVIELVHGRRPAAVVLMADGDGPGQRGAADLARALTPHCADVRIVTPPETAKDIRAWVIVGASRADVLGLIAAAEPLQISVRSRKVVRP